MLKWYESSGCSRFVPQSTLVEFMRWGKGKTQLGLLQMRLSEYLSLHRMSETAFAKHIGLSQAAVNRYLQRPRASARGTEGDYSRNWWRGNGE